MLLSLNFYQGEVSYTRAISAFSLNVSCLQTGGPVCQSNQFFLYTNMEEYHLKYHDDVYTDSFHVLFFHL